MTRIIKLILIGFSLILTRCTVNDDTFEVGQIWHYDTRQGEENSTLTIVSMENNKDYGLIIGVYVDNLNIPLNGISGGNTVINFMPFNKKALKESVTRIQGHTDELPDYKQHYKAWKKEFDNKNCKIFLSPVKVMLDSTQMNLEKMINNK